MFFPSKSCSRSANQSIQLLMRSTANMNVLVKSPFCLINAARGPAVDSQSRLQLYAISAIAFLRYSSTFLKAFHWIFLFSAKVICSCRFNDKQVKTSFHETSYTLYCKHLYIVVVTLHLSLLFKGIISFVFYVLSIYSDLHLLWYHHYYMVKIAFTRTCILQSVRLTKGPNVRKAPFELNRCLSSLCLSFWWVILPM